MAIKRFKEWRSHLLMARVFRYTTLIAVIVDRSAVRLHLECVPIPFWNKVVEKLVNSYSFSIVHDSLTNCM